MSFKLSIGIYGLENLYGGNPKGLIEVAQKAEQAGIDQLSMTDHVVMGSRTDRYPYGEFPSPPETPWLEPMTIEAAIAGSTDKIELSQGILISPLRSAALLAKQVGTLDALAPGRVVMGLGTGWQREEFEASGLPFAGRKSYMFEQIGAMKALWKNAPASYQGEKIAFDDIYCRPAPETVPCWVGVKANEENSKAIAEVADGWIPIEQDPAVFGEGVKTLRRAFENAGRDPAELQVRAMVEHKFDSDGNPDFQATIETIPAMLEAGATYVEILPLYFVYDTAMFDEFFGRLTEVKKQYS
ncbi:putative F420-dependent oxidoreductase [Litorivivens lipolytica]|uniref:Putative F420-dependent oxidoreductase n=1 Tax=Litorivivens lipolytica TaxID=1524264 RepID=A0A7W4W5K0_9GAMM|nr:TIGR03619 family F420-dependent LLM class oxidoreductase [Litorivivens lipolytica]MBB3047857.1 putative F420-dependent oxidoreductase [Litorivivens lipolytica]